MMSLDTATWIRVALPLRAVVAVADHVADLMRSDAPLADIHQAEDRLDDAILAYMRARRK